MKYQFFAFIVLMAFSLTGFAQVQIDHQVQMTGGTNTDRQITNVGDPGSNTHAMNVNSEQRNAVLYAADTSTTANIYAIALSPAPSYTSYPTGMVVYFKAANANTGAATLKVNGIAGAALVKNVNTALASGDINAGQMVTALFDGVNFQILAQTGSSSGGGSAACITLPTKTSPAGYYFTGYFQTFSAPTPRMWYTSKSAYPKPRLYSRAAAYNNSIYIFGGKIVSGNSSDNALAYIYTPATNTWTANGSIDGSMNYDRYGLSVVNGIFYFTAGLKNSACGDGSNWSYDPGTNTYTQLASNASFYQHAVAVFNNNIYCFAGQGQCCGNCYQSNVRQYNIAGNSWVQKAGFPVGLYGASADSVNGKIYIMGGTQDGGSPMTNVYEYNPLTDSYTAKSSMPTGRWDMSEVVYNNKIYTFGGNIGGGETSIVEVYNPSTDSWQSQGGEPMPSTRAAQGAAVVNNKIYLIGGYDGAFPYNDTWEYNPASDTGPVFYMHCKQ